MEIRLSEWEIAHAEFEAGIRTGNNVENDTPQKHGMCERDDTIEFESVAAEFAVAKGLNQYPSGIIGLRSPDVGRDIQVRYVTKDHYTLLVHLPKEGDDPEHIYVLVTGRGGTYVLRGWLRGREAQLERFWRTTLPSPAYSVPQACLRSMEELIQSGRERVG